MDIKQILMDAGIDAEVAEVASKQIGTQQAKEFVPKDQYNKKAGSVSEIEEKYNSLKNDFDAKENELRGMQKIKSDYDTLVTEHNNYKQGIETKESNNTKMSKLKDSLKAKGFNEKIIPLLTKEFDLNTIELEEDKIKGWEELSKGVVEGYKDFISTTAIEGIPSATPIKGDETGSDPFLDGFDKK